MKILTVVSNKSEHNQAFSNFIEKASKLSIEVYVVLPKGLELLYQEDPNITYFPLDNFGSFCEFNVATICSLLDPKQMILKLDPDEFCSADTLKVLSKASSEHEGKIVAVAFQYLFDGIKLKGTPWGGVRYFPRLMPAEIHSKITQVHSRPTGPFINLNLTEPLLHYWARSLGELRERHRRYVALEGKARLSEFGLWKLWPSVLRNVRILGGVIRRFRPQFRVPVFLLSLEFLKYQIQAEFCYFLESEKSRKTDE